MPESWSDAYKALSKHPVIHGKADSAAFSVYSVVLAKWPTVLKANSRQ